MTSTKLMPKSVVQQEGSFVHPLGIYLDIVRKRAASKSTPSNPNRPKKRKTKALPSNQSNRDSPVSKSKVRNDRPTAHAKCNVSRTNPRSTVNSQPDATVKRKHSEKPNSHQIVPNLPKPEPILKSHKQLSKSRNNRPDFDHTSKRSRIKSSGQSIPGRPRPTTTGTRPEVWFDDVPPALIAASREDQSATGRSLIKASSFSGPTRRIAIDCEFVGVGYEGKENALARVSIVNQFGHVLLDTLVRPEERVTDYRTRYSGIRPEDLRPGGSARPFREVHKEVAKLCQGRILVGHSLGNDLKVLMLSHPRRHIRDTSRYRPFRALFNGRTPSLRALTERVLGVQVQAGEHDSVEDARAAMRLYTSVKRTWESGTKGRDLKHLGIPLPAEKIEQTQAAQATLDVLTEYESGLDPIGDPVKTHEVPVKKAKAKPVAWDKSRNRRCSKKRSKFLQKRSKRSRNRGFQSAQM